MKKILILALILGCALIATAFTWEGELDPNDFDNWEIVSTLPNPQAGYAWVIIKNPWVDEYNVFYDAETAAIDRVAMLVDSYQNLLGYRYFKDGEPYGYFFDIEQKKYVRHEYSQEEKNGCMECHKQRAEAERTSI